MRTFYPLSETMLRKLDEKFFVFDIETEGLGGDFVFGCLYGKFTKKVFYNITDIKKEFKLGKYKGKYIFAHNAEFDLTKVYGNILQNLDSEAIFNGKFICATNGNVKFADSLNLLPNSLEEIGKLSGLKKLELHNKFKTGKKVTTVTNKDIEYCFRDCQVIYDALLDLFEESQDIKITIAGLAMNYFRRKFLNYTIKSNEDFDRTFYDSYYGGRVECFKLGITKSYKYDVNSMYPFVMQKMFFPNPQFFKKETKVHLSELQYYFEKYEGNINCTVEHEKNLFGYLPYRTDKGKLIFPYGKFRGTWNFNEIKFALKSKKVKILKIHYINYAERMPTIFYEYVKEVYYKKEEFRGTLKGYIYKLFLNSLYGKFASKEKIKTKYFEKMDKKFFKDLDNKNIHYELDYFNKNRNDFYARIFYYRPSHYTIPSISSYITSEARIELLKLFEKHKNKIITYCDTDCICTEKMIHETGNKLGQIKLEKNIVTRITGNKYYSEKNEKGIEFLKIKGVPKRAIINKEGEHCFDKLVKTKESIRRNIKSGSVIPIKKYLSNKYEKRNLLLSSKFTEMIKIA